MSKLYENLALLSTKELEAFSGWLNFAFHGKGEKEKVLFSLIYSNKKLIKNRDQIRTAIAGLYKDKKKISNSYFNSLEHSLLMALEDFFAFQALKEDHEIRDISLLKFLQKKDSGSLISKRFRREKSMLEGWKQSEVDRQDSNKAQDNKQDQLKVFEVNSYRFLYELAVSLQHISARENNMGKEDWMEHANHFHNLSLLLEKTQFALAYAAHKHNFEVTSFDLFPIEIVYRSLEVFFQKGKYTMEAYPYLDFLRQFCDLIIKTLDKKYAEIPAKVGMPLLDSLLALGHAKNKTMDRDDIQNMYFLLYNLRRKVKDHWIDKPEELGMLVELRYILEKGIEHKLFFLDGTIPEVILKNLVKLYLRIEELSGEQVMDRFDWQEFLQHTPQEQRQITEILLKAMIHFEKQDYRKVIRLCRFETKIVRKIDINLRTLKLQAHYMLPDCEFADLLQDIDSLRKYLARVMGRKDLGKPYCQQWILFLDIFRKTITADDLATLKRKNLLQEVNDAAQQTWLRQIITQKMKTLS